MGGNRGRLANARAALAAAYREELGRLEGWDLLYFEATKSLNTFRVQR